MFTILDRLHLLAHISTNTHVHTQPHIARVLHEVHHTAHTHTHTLSLSLSLSVEGQVEEGLHAKNTIRPKVCRAHVGAGKVRLKSGGPRGADQ